LSVQLSCNVVSIIILAYTTWNILIAIKTAKSKRQLIKLPLLKHSAAFVLCILAMVVITQTVMSTQNDYMFVIAEICLDVAIMCATFALFQQWDENLKVYIYNKFNAEWIWAKP